MTSNADSLILSAAYKSLWKKWLTQDWRKPHEPSGVQNRKRKETAGEGMKEKVYVDEW